MDFLNDNKASDQDLSRPVTSVIDFFLQITEKVYMHIKYLFGNPVLAIITAIIAILVCIEVAYIFQECKGHKQIKHTTA